MNTIYGNIIKLFKEIYIFRTHFAESVAKSSGALRSFAERNTK